MGAVVIRKAAGIEFPGFDATRSAMIAEVELAETPEWGMRQDALGTHALGRVDYEIVDGEVVYGDSGPVRVMISEKEIETGDEPTLRDLSAALVEVYGTDFGVHSPDVDLEVHRRLAGRRPPTARGGCCWPAMPRTSTTPGAGRASVSASRTP